MNRTIYASEKSIPYNQLANKGSCQNNASYMDNFQKMNNYSDSKHNNIKLDSEIQELKNMLLNKKKSVDSISLESEFINKFYLKAGNKISKAKFVVNTLNNEARLKNCLSFYQLLLEKDFILSVLNQLYPNKSYNDYKVFLKKLVVSYYDYIGLNSMDPAPSLIINTIKLYGRKTNHKIHSKQIHPHILEFEQYLLEKGFKIGQNSNRLMAFLRWLVASNYISYSNPVQIDARDITPQQVSLFYDELVRRINLGLIKRESAQNYIYSLRRWFDFLKLKKYIFMNPTLNLPNFKCARKKDYPLISVSETMLFFDAILLHSKNILRDISLFMTIATVGLRAREALNLNISSVNFNSGSIKFVRKGGSVVTLPLPGITLLFIELYLKSRPTVESNAIWINDYGRRVGYDSLRRHFKKYLNISGISDLPGCHFFRHLLFSELCMKENDLEMLKDLAGHAKIRELDNYIGITDMRVKESFHKKYKPIGSNLFL